VSDHQDTVNRTILAALESVQALTNAHTRALEQIAADLAELDHAKAPASQLRELWTRVDDLGPQRCGVKASPLLNIGPCVLPPDHEGYHTDLRGTRWAGQDGAVAYLPDNQHSRKVDP